MLHPYVHRWIRLRAPVAVLIVLSVTSIAGAVEGDRLSLRQEYNQVSAVIDSLVRAMALIDAEVLKVPRLPEGREKQILPNGMSLVMIFWADDEARVWLNDYPVGETRLTPVEVTVPDMYLQARNRIRARCWDTDWVESGFLCGLYLKDAGGGFHPIVVSDGNWETPEGRATEITYAHPSPNIPGAEVIWGPRIFGVVELSVAFEGEAIQGAVNRAVAAGSPKNAQKHAMDYHEFVQKMAVLQARREALTKALDGKASLTDVPVYTGAVGRSASLTLGKSGSLEEAVSAPVADQVRAWSRELPESQQQLIYPDRRALKGEGAANLVDGDESPTTGEVGARQDAYEPPEERGSSRPGTGEGEGGKGVAGKSNMEGEGQEGNVAGGLSGFLQRRGSRWGLLLPALILALYVGYVLTNWQTVMGREENHTWGD